MTARITVDMNLESSGVAKGAKDAKRALENLEDAVKDTGRDGAKDISKLESELKNVQKASERADASIRGIDTTSKKTWVEASDNVRGFKEEAVQNLAEVASSFNGDISQMADGVQGLSGGLASALTPGIGIPVAILGAAAAAFFASWQKAAEESEARVKEMYEDFTETGQTFVSENYIAESIKQIQSDTGKWNDAQRRVKETGLEIGDILRAMAGDQDEIAAAHDKYVHQRDEEIEKIRESGRSIEDQQVAIDAANTKFAESVEWITQIQRDTGTAADKAEAYRSAMHNSLITAQQLASAVNGIQDRSVTIGVKVNDAAFANWWSVVQRRAQQGITVNMQPGQGRAWE